MNKNKSISTFFILLATFFIQAHATTKVVKNYDPFIDTQELNAKLEILKTELRRELLDRENLIQKLLATEKAARMWQNKYKQAMQNQKTEKDALLNKIDLMQKQIQALHKQDEKEFIQYAHYATPHNKRKIVKNCVKTGNIQELMLLINKKESTIDLNIYGLCAWIEAIKNNKKKVIEYLQTIIPINTLFVVTTGPRKGLETSVLEELALQNNIEGFKRALEAGADPNIVNRSGYSLIEELALQQNDRLLPFIELLKEKHTVPYERARIFANPSLTQEDPTAPKTIAFLTQA